MKWTKICELNSGDFIEHKDYGLCLLFDIRTTVNAYFYAYLTPLTAMGFLNLQQYKRKFCSVHCETDPDLILSKIIKPPPPIYFFTSKSVCLITKWPDDTYYCESKIKMSPIKLMANETDTIAFIKQLL